MVKKKKKIDKFLIFGILFHVILFTACSAEVIRTVTENEENRKKIIKQEEESQEKIEANQVNKGYRRNYDETCSLDRYKYPLLPESNNNSYNFLDEKVAIKGSDVAYMYSDNYGNINFTIETNSLTSGMMNGRIYCFWYNDSNADTVRLKKDIKQAQENGNDVIVYGVYQENPKDIGTYNIYLHDFEILY